MVSCPAWRKPYLSQTVAKSSSRCEETMTMAPRSRQDRNPSLSHSAPRGSSPDHGSSSTTKHESLAPRTLRRPTSCRCTRDSFPTRRRSFVRGPSGSRSRLQLPTRTVGGRLAPPAKYAAGRCRKATRGGMPYNRTQPESGRIRPSSRRSSVVFPGRSHRLNPEQTRRRP